MKPALQLLHEGCPGRAPLGTAVSNAILQRVAAGELPDSGRLGRPGRIVTFGRRDAVSDGYPAAVEAAKAAGYEVVLRIAGGRAAAYNGEALNLSRAHRDPSPAGATQARFAEMADLVRAALSGLGVDARIGEVPGEYCPGAFSVNAGGRVKLAGIGQRLIKGGAHVGCVIVAGGSEELRDVLVPVYEALGIDGTRQQPAASRTRCRACRRRRSRRRSWHSSKRGSSSASSAGSETLALAEQLEPRHRVGQSA